MSSSTPLMLLDAGRTDDVPAAAVDLVTLTHDAIMAGFAALLADLAAPQTRFRRPDVTVGTDDTAG